MSAHPDGVPTLDRLSDTWVSAGDELVHLPSLRNQWGQAHVNADLTSLSWLAIPPYAGGYRTGALRVDGRVVAADSFHWAPWGVRRRASCAGGLTVETDTRLGFEATDVFWNITVTNDGSTARDVHLDAELLAPVAHSLVDWGWLHGTPWNDGHRHDFYTTERIRDGVLGDPARQVQFFADDERVLRLGRPRVAGIQRDEDSAPMLLETTLPSHVTPDSTTLDRPPAAPAEVAWVETSTGSGSQVRIVGPWMLDGGEAEHAIGSAVLGEGAVLRTALQVTGDGIVLTHGNHPDSVQLEVRDGELLVRLGGELLRSARHIADGERHVVEVRISAAGVHLLVDESTVADSSDWRSSQRWAATTDRGAVFVVDTASPARSVFAFSREPDRIAVEGQAATAGWTVHVQPGETVSLGIVLEIDDDEDQASRRAEWAARRFDARFAAIAESWRSLWADAFTPGNESHSGYLPTFTSDDEGLELGYYYAVLLAVYMRNTGVSSIGPVFLTGGPRLGATTTFYWDQSEWSRIGAMLEPKGVRAWIVAALGQPYESSHSFDTFNLLPVGNHYASNDHALFTIIEHYVGTTGDSELLDEVVRGRSVLEHLTEMAYRPHQHPAAYAGGVLMDFGRDAWELLECVPNYRDAVVSFNAGYAGMLRSLGDLLDSRGAPAAGAQARAAGDRLAAAVLEQYAGAGRWRIGHPDGDDTIGHCLDFGLVAAHLADDLTPVQREELAAFVAGHLIDGNWMRALAPDDPIAPLSDRPDHGAAGAFAGWPGATSYGLAKIGRSDLAAGLLSRIHLSRSGALWGQAVEALGGGRFRVAERGVSNRDSNAAVAPAEAVVGGLFGIGDGFGRAGGGVLENRFGRLRNVRAVGFDLPLASDAEVTGGAA